jgi:hypothetical protein
VNKSDLMEALAAKENLNRKTGSRRHQADLQWIYRYNEKGRQN